MSRLQYNQGLCQLRNLVVASITKDPGHVRRCHTGSHCHLNPRPILTYNSGHRCKLAQGRICAGWTTRFQLMIAAILTDYGDKLTPLHLTVLEQAFLQIFDNRLRFGDWLRNSGCTNRGFYNQLALIPRI